jgi:class 3 adenylate cyclase
MARRLTAILAADVVGYSRLMAADEQGTHVRVKALRQDFIEPKIAEHRGRVGLTPALAPADRLEPKVEDSGTREISQVGRRGEWQACGCHGHARHFRCAAARATVSGRARTERRRRSWPGASTR